MAGRMPFRSRLGARLRARAEKDGRGYPDWATRYLPVLWRWRGRDTRAGQVLEIGANANGYARFSRLRVIAVDIALEHLKEARAAQGVIPVAGNAAALPFRDGSVAHCVCMDTLEHLPENTRLQAVREIARVLETGGAGVIGFPSGHRARRAEERVRNAYARYSGGTIAWLEEHAAHSLPELDEIEPALSNALGMTHKIARTGNVNIWVWVWMWRVLMCGWPGIGNAAFQVLLRWLAPLLARCSFPPYYRNLLWIEPRRGDAK